MLENKYLCEKKNWNWFCINETICAQFKLYQSRALTSCFSKITVIMRNKIIKLSTNGIDWDIELFIFIFILVVQFDWIDLFKLDKFERICEGKTRHKNNWKGNSIKTLPSVNLIRLLLWAKALSSVYCIVQYNAFNVHKFSYYLHIFGEYWSNAPLPMSSTPLPPLKYLACSAMHIKLSV